MTDIDIINIYKDKVVHSWKTIPNTHKEYLISRFNDSKSIKESCWRILYSIEKRPTCQICGNPVIFNGRKNNIFSKTCCKECELKLKANLTKNRNYSEEQKQQIKDKTRQTKLEKYGDENYNNRDKAKLTCLEKYGETSYNKTNEGKEKIKKSMQEKYGVDYAAYLDTNIFKTDNPQQHNEIKEKTKNTRINKYGQYMSPNNIESLKTNKVKEKRVDSFNKTMIDKYGNTSYRNLEKHKKTCLEKYGVDSYFKTEEFKKFFKESQPHIQQKTYETHKKNNSFNISKPENLSYELLKEKFTNVIRQYKSDVYPFACDFYIPELDLYIECNYSWLHGGHPYDNTNEEDKKMIEIWKEKNTPYYNNAIGTWTIRDVNKRNIAKQNNLNYIEFWNLEELKCWLYNKFN